MPQDAKRPNYIEEEDLDIPKPEGAFPQLGIVQGLSEQKDPDSVAYIKGAREGQLFHSEAGRLWDGKKGVLVVPLAVTKVWIEYIPRKQGGGVVQMYNSAEEANASADPKNDLAPSVSYLCILPEHPDCKVTAVRLGTPSKMKVHRKWAGLVQAAKTLYGQQYRVSVVREKNRVGQAYYNFDIQPAGWVPKQLYQSLAEQAKQISAATQRRMIAGPDAEGETQAEM